MGGIAPHPPRPAPRHPSPPRYNHTHPSPRDPHQGGRIQEPATSRFEKVLLEVFAEALAAGESFVDVTARSLHTRVNGATKNAQGMAECQRLMRRMMIPGDCELQSSFRAHAGSLWIRFRIPR